MERIAILGATGSIGQSTLDVLERHRNRYQIYALTGHRRIDVLARQILSHGPQRAVVADRDAATRLRQLVGDHRVQISHGQDALIEVACEADVLMAAIVGSAGLPAVLAAAKAGRKILLANKEALVMGGRLFIDAVNRHGATLLPIDSEHNAIFQCLPRGRDTTAASDGIARIILTASGGPFRTTPVEQMLHVTPEQACAHPNWVMGRKISVDSATMMNKGLEVIEAHWLFGLSAEHISVVIHPQSVIHSLVSFVDGSMIAQLGHPDMRTPIAYALAYPDRIESGVAQLDLAQLGALHFEAPDFGRFPCLRLAYEALRAGGSAPPVLNAANEVAVAAFLSGELGFMEIARVVEETLQALPVIQPGSIEELIDVDDRARIHAAFVKEHLA